MNVEPVRWTAATVGMKGKEVGEGECARTSPPFFLLLMLHPSSSPVCSAFCFLSSSHCFLFFALFLSRSHHLDSVHRTASLLRRLLSRALRRQLTHAVFQISSSLCRALLSPPLLLSGHPGYPEEDSAVMRPWGPAQLPARTLACIRRLLPRFLPQCVEDCCILAAHHARAGELPECLAVYDELIVDLQRVGGLQQLDAASSSSSSSSAAAPLGRFSTVLSALPPAQAVAWLPLIQQSRRDALQLQERQRQGERQVEQSSVVRL
jgi:hypothetical protein